MGIYVVPCTECSKPFQWFSGDLEVQSCSSCRNKKKEFTPDQKLFLANLETNGTLYEMQRLFDKFNLDLSFDIKPKD